MADQKITQLDENTAPAITDLLVIVDDPGGSPATQKVTVQNLVENIGAADLDVDSGVLHVDASNNRVGINNTTPSTALDVTGAGTFSGNITTGGTLESTGFVKLGPRTELTISGGVITVTGSFHDVDTESDAANDDLDTINGGGALGNILVLRAAADARTVTVKSGTGNILLDGGADFALDDRADMIMLMYNKSNWCEISRSNNT